MTSEKHISGIGKRPLQGHPPYYFLLYRDDGQWIAHCLNFNILYGADTIAEALTGVGELLVYHVKRIIELGDKASPVEGAPKEFIDAYVCGHRLDPNLRVNLRVVDDLKIPSTIKVPEPNVQVKEPGLINIAMVDGSLALA